MSLIKKKDNNYEETYLKQAQREIKSTNRQKDLDAMVIDYGREGFIEVVEYLIDQGANITDQAVWIASYYGQLKMVEYMIKKGGNVFKK